MSEPDKCVSFQLRPFRFDGLRILCVVDPTMSASVEDFHEMLAREHFDLIILSPDDEPVRLYNAGFRLWRVQFFFRMNDSAVKKYLYDFIGASNLQMVGHPVVGCSQMDLSGFRRDE